MGLWVTGVSALAERDGLNTFGYVWVSVSLIHFMGAVDLSKYILARMVVSQE